MMTLVAIGSELKTSQCELFSGTDSSFDHSTPNFSLESLFSSKDHL